MVAATVPVPVERVANLRDNCPEAPRAPRPATPARWAAALKRARDAGVDILFVGGDAGRYAVESATTAGVVYLVTVDGRGCSCPAGQGGDECCLHRALVLWLTNRIDDDGTPARCRECTGTGRVEVYTGGGLDSWEAVACRECSGSGRVPPPVACPCRGAGWVEVDEWVDGAVFAVATACGCDAGVAWEAEMVARAEVEADRRPAA